MINFSTITKAVEELLTNNLPGYVITRNEEINSDPNVATRYKGWVGVYRGSLEYEAYTVGAGRRWMTNLEILIVLQAASLQNGAEAEDRLQDAEKEIMDVLTANPTLSGSVAMTTGYSIEYEYKREQQVYFHAAIITIKGQVRA